MSMRIVLLSHGSIRLPVRRRGGVEGLILAAAAEWAAFGHDALILDRRYSPGDPEFEDLDGFRIVRLSCPHFHFLGNSKSPKARLIGDKLDRLWFALHAEGYLRRLDVLDVVNVYDPVVAIAIALRGGKRLAGKIIYTHTSSHFLPSARARDWIVVKWLLRQVAIRCGWVVLQSEETRKQFLALGIVDPKRTSVIPPGVHLDFWGSKVESLDLPKEWAGREIVLYVGRINREKGLDTLVNAMGKVVKVHGRPNVLLLLVGPIEEFDWSSGDSWYSKQLKARIVMAGIERHTCFTGEVDAERVRSYYRWSKVVTLPSLTEVFGMVLTEAMAAGSPVIASDTHGARMQIKQGVTGILVRVGDAEALASAIVQLLKDEEKRRHLAERGILAAAAFSWPSVAKEYLRVFEFMRSRTQSAVS